MQSITDLSLAMWAVGSCPRFELCSKQELLQTLLVSAQSWGCHTGELWALPWGGFAQRQWSPEVMCELPSSPSCIPSQQDTWVLALGAVAGEHGASGRRGAAALSCGTFVGAAGVAGPVPAGSGQRAHGRGRQEGSPAPLPTLRVSLCDLQEVIQEEPQESPVHPRAIVAIKQLR